VSPRPASRIQIQQVYSVVYKLRLPLFWELLPPPVCRPARISEIVRCIGTAGRGRLPAGLKWQVVVSNRERVRVGRPRRKW